MAIETELPAVPVKAENRTWRVEIECRHDMAVADRAVTFHREVVPLDRDGQPAGPAVQSRVAVGSGFLPLRVTATFAELGARSFTAAGVTVTGAQMMALIALVGDALWQEAVAAELDRQTKGGESA